MKRAAWVDDVRKGDGVLAAARILAPMMGQSIPEPPPLRADPRRIVELEHSLGIVDEHPVGDCSRCDGLREVREGRCHQYVGGMLIRTMQCPHEE